MKQTFLEVCGRYEVDRLIGTTDLPLVTKRVENTTNGPTVFLLDI